MVHFKARNYKNICMLYAAYDGKQLLGSVTEAELIEYYSDHTIIYNDKKFTVEEFFNL